MTDTPTTPDTDTADDLIPDTVWDQLVADGGPAAIETVVAAAETAEPEWEICEIVNGVVRVAAPLIAEHARDELRDEVARLRDEVSSPCCDLHQPGNCCEPFDCGPCCRNCPDCPSHNHTRRPRVWFDGDTIPAGVRVIAEDGDVHPDPDDMDEEWENGNLGPLVEFTVDYDAEVAHARREREGGDQ